MNPTGFDLTAPGALLFALSVAVVDLCTHRIPNVLTLSGIVLGFAMSIEAAGSAGAISSSGGLVVGLLIFMPLYVGGGFSAGDVKAMAATGAFLGTTGAAAAAMLTLVAGALIAVLVLIANRELAALETLKQRVMVRFVVLFAGSRLEGTSPAVSGRGADRRFPYGVAIAAGTVAALVWLDRLPTGSAIHSLRML